MVFFIPRAVFVLDMVYLNGFLIRRPQVRVLPGVIVTSCAYST